MKASRATAKFEHRPVMRGTILRHPQRRPNDPVDQPVHQQTAAAMRDFDDVGRRRPGSGTTRGRVTLRSSTAAPRPGAR